jgi:hypothetical protein
MTKDEALKLAHEPENEPHVSLASVQEPVDGTQVSKVWWDGEKLMAKPIPLEDIYQPVDWKAEYLKSVESGCITLDELREANAELAATNRQVEILSDALAESRREVAALKAVQEPVGYWLIGTDHVEFDKYEYHDGPEWEAIYTTPPAQTAVPDAFGTREGEHPQYIQGWNDCRAEMLKGMKP